MPQGEAHKHSSPATTRNHRAGITREASFDHRASTRALKKFAYGADDASDDGLAGDGNGHEKADPTPAYPLEEAAGASTGGGGGGGGDDDDPWEEKFDEHSGLPYFVHRVTGESAWDKPGTEEGDAGDVPLDSAPLDDLDDLGSEESVYEHTTESNPAMWGTVVDSKPDDDEDNDAMASMVGAMMHKDDDDNETVGSEESVYEHTTESNPNMWGTVVDSKPDADDDDGDLAGGLAGLKQAIADDKNDG